MGPYLPTYNGEWFNYLNPDPEQISLNDIAKALSNLCRFQGHCNFYSVAQHSVYVSQHCDPEDAKHGLLHDAHEAYVGDIVGPIKNNFKLGAFMSLTDSIQKSIHKKFGMEDKCPESVKDVDARILHNERSALFQFHYPEWEIMGKPLDMDIMEIWMPHTAYVKFLERAEELGIE